ncbi:MAG TPA: hypothetical protein VGB67_12710 [Fibrella sp.]|jgi:hypothetical protein
MAARELTLALAGFAAQSPVYPSSFYPDLNALLPTVAGSSSTIFATASDAFIFNQTETALPGDCLTVHGQFTGSAEICLGINSNIGWTKLTVLQQTANLIQAQIPDHFPMGVYRVWVKQTSGISNKVYFNKAIGYAGDSNVSYAGGPLAISGRDLLFGKKTPIVKLVSQTTGITLTADVIYPSNRFCVYAQVPLAVVTGQTYDVYVNNGYDVINGDSKLEAGLQIIAPQKDNYGLGIGWCAKFTNTQYNNVWDIMTDSRITTKPVRDGVANDQTVVNNILAQVSTAGGGRVKLGTGSFKFTGGTRGLTIPSNVVVEGDGPDKTFINYDGQTSSFLYANSSTTANGLKDVSLIHTSSTGVTPAAQIESDFTFFKNVKVENNNLGKDFKFSSSDRNLVLGCEFNQTGDPRRYTTWYVSCEYSVMRNNRYRFSVQGIAASTAYNTFVQNNIFERNNGITLLRDPDGTDTICHLTSLASCPNTLIQSNRFVSYNGPPVRDVLTGGAVDQNGLPTVQRENDGETMITENVEPWLTSWMATGGTSTSIIDTKQNWTGQFVGRSPRVFISQGKGMGQTRTIVDRTTTAINVDRPWDVIPDATSRYVAHNWDNNQFIMHDNYVENQNRGFTFYGANSYRVDIVGNKLINSGAIDFMAHHIDYQQNSANPRNSVMLNINIEDNLVDGSSDPTNGAAINLLVGNDRIPSMRGTQILAGRIARNTVKGSVPNKFVIVDTTYPSGINCYIAFAKKPNSGPEFYFIPDGNKSILGNIIQDNITVNCDKNVNLGANVAYTIVAGHKVIHPTISTVVSEYPMYVAPSGAVSTINSQNTLIIP